MKCDNCSKCCEFMVIRIGEPVNDDYKIWAEYHGVKIININGINYAKIDNKCSHLIGKRCGIHSFKPKLCRDFHCEDQKYKEFNKILWEVQKIDTKSL